MSTPLNGVPNETRQPFADGSTDFERILPGPDRMYPDTDSPPTRVTRERVARLRAGLAERPWEREARYSAAGVADPVIHFLIRRGGAAIVDRLARETGADLKQACFLLGEKLVYLRREGSRSTAFPTSGGRSGSMRSGSSRCSGRLGNRYCARWRPTPPRRSNPS